MLRLTINYSLPCGCQLIHSALTDEVLEGEKLVSAHKNLSTMAGFWLQSRLNFHKCPAKKTPKKAK